MPEIDPTDAPTGVGHAESPGRSRRVPRRAAGRRERSTVVSTSGTAVFGASPVTMSAALTRMGQAGAAALIFGTGAREDRAASSAAMYPVFITGASRAERKAGLRLARRYHEVRAADVKRDASAVRGRILEFITQAAPQG